MKLTAQEKRVLEHFYANPHKRQTAKSASCRMNTLWSLSDKGLIKCVRTLDCFWMADSFHREHTYFIRTPKGRKVCSKLFDWGWP